MRDSRNTRRSLPLLLGALLLSSGCAHREPAPAPPPVIVRPVLPPVTLYPPGQWQSRMEAILAPYLQPIFGATPTTPSE